MADEHSYITGQGEISVTCNSDAVILPLMLVSHCEGLLEMGSHLAAAKGNDHLSKMFASAQADLVEYLGLPKKE